MSGGSITADLPPHDPNDAVPWLKLMRLERINDNTFRSTCRAFNPFGDDRVTGQPKRAYGGHVYAQAVLAASKTLPSSRPSSAASQGHEGAHQPRDEQQSEHFVCHSVTGYFTLPASSELPFVYTVRRVRDGRGFCVRTVQVTQLETAGVCFTCTASFKLFEHSQIEYQARVNLRQSYGQVLGVREPADFADAPSTEAPWSHLYRGPPFPGLVTKKVDMAAYNTARSPLERRQLYFYKVVGAIPPFDEEPNMHVAAHLYASDRNSLFAVSRHLGLDENYGRMASLTHTVVLHSTGRELDLGNGNWFTQETWTDRFGDGRGVHHSRIWDASGDHVATTLQDGLIRLQFENDEDLKAKREAIEGKSRL